MTSKLDREELYADFSGVVNMAAEEIELWLESDHSRAVGWKGANGDRPESVGHASGRRIVQILRKKRDEISADDYEHMRKVVGYVRRHSAQRPENVYTSRWRYSLMNWGHDPVKEDEK